jgi:hypothetical protein
MENIKNKGKDHKNPLQDQQLWKFSGIFNRSTIHANEINKKKAMSYIYKPTAKIYPGVIKIRNKSLHKNTFLSPQIYKEGLSYIHRLKNTNKTEKPFSPTKKIDTKMQTPTHKEFKNLNIKEIPILISSSSISPVSKKNQSQQTLKQDFVNNSEYDEPYHMVYTKQLNYSPDFRIKKFKQNPKLKLTTYSNVSGWRNE